MIFGGLYIRRAKHSNQTGFREQNRDLEGGYRLYTIGEMQNCFSYSRLWV